VQHAVQRPVQPMRRRASSGQSKRVWLFDLDDTLHDASAHVFPALHRAMTGYLQGFLGVSHEQADATRHAYWKRYGATLLGMMDRHGVDPHHFLRETHRLPELEARLRAHPRDTNALRHLAGRRIVVTNAPRAYALRVLRGLGLHRHVDALVSIESMRMFGHWRPKPDPRTLKRLVVRLKSRASDCVLVEDTLANLRSAQGLGMKTAWVKRHARPKSRSAEVGVYVPVKPKYVYARMNSMQTLRRW
jgi:putative hydrolase of the HAD superfamily